MARRKMSDDHKAALAKGRRQGRAVRDYLAALETSSRRGPKATPEKVSTRIAELEERIESEENPARRVELIQERLDNEDRLKDLEDQPDMDALREEFVDVVKEYSERKEISYTAWRELGVPAADLRDGGVPRTRRSA